jgi:hypothetical protein
MVVEVDKKSPRIWHWELYDVDNSIIIPHKALGTFSIGRVKGQIVKVL